MLLQAVIMKTVMGGTCSTHMGYHLKDSWDDSVGIVTRQQTGQSGVQIPAGARDASILKNDQTSSADPPASYPMGTEFFHGGKAAEERC
jgi:hypothetical protein